MFETYYQISRVHLSDKLLRFSFRKSVKVTPFFQKSKQSTREGFAFYSQGQAQEGFELLQGGMTAPPEGLQRNFTRTPTSTINLAEGLPAKGKGRRQTGVCPRSIILSSPSAPSPVYQGAYDPFSPRYEKVARSEEESSQSMLLK